MILSSVVTQNHYQNPKKTVGKSEKSILNSQTFNFAQKQIINGYFRCKISICCISDRVGA